MGGRLDYTISYDFHLTNGRQSRLIHHYLTPILLSDDGRIWLALCTVSLAATDEPGHIIMQKNGERSYFEYSTSRHKWEKKAKMGVKNIAEALFHATNYQMI